MVINNYSAEQFTSILQSFADLIFLLDDDGSILDYIGNENPQWLYVPKEHFIRKRYFEVLPLDVSIKIAAAMNEMREGKDSVTFDYSLQMRGVTAWFTAAFSRLIKSGDMPATYVCVIREITEKKEKELLLQGILDNAFNAFIVFGVIRSNEGRVIDFQWLMVNHVFEKLTGTSQADLQNKRLSDFPAPEWMLFPEYVRVAETGNEVEVEYRVKKPLTAVWLRTHVTKLEDRLIVTLKDITEEKKDQLDLQNAMEQLRVSRQAMDLFFSQALSGFYFMMLDGPLQWDESIDKEAALDRAINHLRFTRVNDALLEQYGATREQFLKLTLNDFFRGDIENMRSLLRQLYDNGRIAISRASRKMDGSELWIEGNYICFTDENNHVLGHFGIQQDVTDRKRAEDSLRASEERYRLLANNMLDFVALHAPDGTYQYASPSVYKILGYTPGELIGTNPYTLFHPDDITSIEEQSHRHAREGKDVANIEYRIRKKDGKYIWFSTNTRPIINAMNQVTMLQTVSRDVTERVETMRLLEELNQQKNKLFSIIAHDLRGPLSSCMGLLGLMQKSSTGDDLQKYLRLARKSAFNLHDLMEDLLLWAGSQLNRISFAPAILNIKDEMETATRRLLEMAASKNISLDIDVPDDSLSVLADKEMLHTIIRNLVSNAIKFTETGGRVNIHAIPVDGRIEISVADNGVGIKKEDLERLFSKNSTFTTYGTGGERGTGLGLDICKDFIEKHKGTIKVESEVGKGSKFIFTLREF